MPDVISKKRGVRVVEPIQWLNGDDIYVGAIVVVVVVLLSSLLLLLLLLSSLLVVYSCSSRGVMCWNVKSQCALFFFVSSSGVLLFWREQ